MSQEELVGRARRMLAGIEKNHSPSALASSFGAEDMVVLDLIARDGLAIDIFTLDTGRLPQETHDLIAQVRDRYGLEIEIFTPWPDSVDSYVEQYSVDGFYESVDARKACCAVRKVEPLRRALARKKAWITGLRREQSDTRAALPDNEFDPAFGLWKFSPLADWTEEDVWVYLRSNHIPYNTLHDKGYPSIGCEPCTRAVKKGEHPRAGRWWWEQDGARKECGLHEIPVKVLEKIA
jgi:phosphoadenosine phosphosulfate reductase